MTYRLDGEKGKTNMIISNENVKNAAMKAAEKEIARWHGVCMDLIEQIDEMEAVNDELAKRIGALETENRILRSYLIED